MQFDSEILVNSIKSAFKARNNKLPKVLPTILTDESVDNDVKRIQWNAFTQRSALMVPIGEWADVIAEIRTHLKSVLERIGVHGA